MDGTIEQPHLRPWATALRIPTRDGVVWFKASLPAFAHEGRVLELLRPSDPSLLPDVIASTPEGWLLMADAGRRAREHPVDWSAVWRRYACLQIASAGVVDELVAAGAYDNRPGHVLTRVEALMRWLPAEVADDLRSRLPYVRDRIGRLASSRLPTTVDHGDLHDGNVFSRDDRVLILDWGDSAVAHPFLSLTVAEPEAFRPYLDEWEGHAPRDELDEELEIVCELRFLLRALNWEHVAVLTGGNEHLVDRVRRFLASRPAGCPHPRQRLR